MRDLIYEMSNTAYAILKVCCGDGVRSFPQSPLIASRWESVELLHSLEGGMGDDSGRSYAVEPSLNVVLAQWDLTPLEQAILRDSQ